MPTTPQIQLLVVVIYTQLVLWGSYAWLIPRHNTATFWGNIPKHLWSSYMRWALVAYILNMSLYIYYGCKPSTDDETVVQVLLTLLVYYGLQMLFIPSTIYGNRTLIRVLLGICVIPIGYLKIGRAHV